MSTQTRCDACDVRFGQWSHAEVKHRFFRWKYYGNDAVKETEDFCDTCYTHFKKWAKRQRCRRLRQPAVINVYYNNEAR